MSISTDKQKRAREHNWLRAQVTSAITAMKFVMNSDTTTNEAKEKAKSAYYLIGDLNNIELLNRVDPNGQIEFTSKK